MPELPEVEVICRGLQPHLVGRTITAISFSGKQLRNEVPIDAMRKTLIGTAITNIARRAKFILITFKTGDTLIVHLGMSGTLTICREDAAVQKHDHLLFTLDSGYVLRYNDIRRFGSFTLLEAQASCQMESTVFKHTGPEPFGNKCTALYLHNRAAASRTPIKTFLMDTSVIAGIGNIYANEILYAAGIHPETPASRLDLAGWEQLLRIIREILEWAIGCGGSTISDFINSEGKQGYFQANFKVYGKALRPCTKCGDPIQRVVIGGRSTFFCERCQKR